MAIKLWSANFNALSLDIDGSGHAEYWLKGGRGSGKSTFIARKILLGMLANPRASAAVFRRVAATLRQSVYEEFTKAVESLGLRPWCEFRLSPMEIRFRPTGQKIVFRGADDPGKSKSITLAKGYFGYLWFEEASEFPGTEDLDTIKASVIRGAADRPPVTFYSYNPPKSAQNWINKAVLAPDARRLVHHSCYMELPAAWIGESFIAEAEALRQSNERAWRHVYKGEVTGTGGQVFDNVALRAITAGDINAIGKYYNGLDFGFAVDPDAFTRWGWNPKERAIVAVAEYYGAHTPTDVLAEKVKAAAGNETVRCDSADPRMIAELRQRGVNAVGVKKGPGSVEHGMRWLQDLGKIIIDPARTPNTAREFSAYEYQSDRNGNFLPDYPDMDNHTIDSGRYALEPVIGQKGIKTVSKGFGLMTLEEVKAYIEYDRAERERREKLYRYYRTHNDILDAPKKEDDKPDNRMAHGFANYICNAFTGYMFGEPVTYAPLSEEGRVDPDAEALSQALHDCYDYNDEQAENTTLGLDCAICGAAVEILYVDTDARVRFGRVDPVGCVAKTDGTIEDALTELIRYYDRYDVVNRRTMRTIEVYDAQAVTVWRSIGEGLDTYGEPEVKEHFFGDVPVVVYRNNLFGKGDAEGVLSLIDGYDRMQSDGLNDQQYFSDAYLAMYGVTELENAKEMRRNRLLLMPGDSKAEWLVKAQNDTTPQNIKDRLNRDIHRFSACPDMSDENFAGNSSGVALAYKLLQFENVAGIKEREFKRGLQRRLELLCNFWGVKGMPRWDWRRMKIAFHRALPQNLLELSQVVYNLGEVVSSETKRELLPLDIDEATERQRLAEEYGDSLFRPRERSTGNMTPEEPADAGGTGKRITGFQNGE